MSEGLTRLEERINEFNALLEEMRQETREAHSVLKQLHHAQREIERMLQKDVKKMVDDRAGEIISKELAELGPGIRKQTNLIYDKVGREIDKLIDLSMGKEFARQRDHEDLRPELAKKLKAWLREIVMNEGLYVEGLDLEEK